MKVIVAIGIIYFIMLFIDKKKNHERSTRFLINRLLKISFTVFGLYIFSGWWMYDVVTADIDEEYERAFETPIEKISNLEGYGGGFQDFYLQLCFNSNENVVLKDAEKFIILKDSSSNVDIINKFKGYFAGDRYENYNQYLININPNDVVIKKYEYKIHDYECYKILLNIKDKGIYFYKAN